MKWKWKLIVIFLLVNIIIIVVGSSYSLLDNRPAVDAPLSLSRERTFNVRDFGAMGDGIQDDASAIQLALDKAAQYRPAAVYLPAGQYKVSTSKPLTVPANVTVFGQGEQTVIQADSDRFGWQLLRIHGDHITLNKLVLDGRRSVNRVIVVEPGSMDVRLSRVTITGASQSEDRDSPYHDQVVSGIIILGDTARIELDDIDIYDIHAPYGDKIARGIYATTTWNSREKPPRQVSVTHSRIRKVGPAKDGDCIYFEDQGKEAVGATAIHSDSVISGNIFSGCAKRAIKLFADGVTVSDNDIDNTGMVANMFAGISAYGDDITIEGNSIGGTGSYYAAVEIGASVEVQRVHIVGNTIQMGELSRQKDTTGIRVGSIVDFVIANNRIEHGERAIWIWQDAVNGLVRNNRIYVPAGGGIDLTKQHADDIRSNIRIENNVIKSKHDVIEEGE